MTLTSLAVHWRQTFTLRPVLASPVPTILDANVAKVRPGLGSLMTRLRLVPMTEEDDLGEDFPAITACYEAFRNHCKLMEVLAELRGDDPGDIA